MPKKYSCFISYSYDSANHVQWVNRFAKRLARSGITVHLDNLDNRLGDDLVHYMVAAVEGSSRVILICTPKYCRKLTGGAAFEKMLVGSELASNAMTNKFIPVLRAGDKTQSIPKFLHTKIYISMQGKSIKEADIVAIVRSVRASGHSKKARKSTKGIPISTETSTTPHPSLVDISDVSRIRLVGYTLLGGRGADGIRYLWKTQENAYTESAAFNSRIKAYEISQEDKSISAYTTSVSFGCQLQSMGIPCTFCATGRLRFRGNLTGEEIALQNIFMAEYDSDCPSWPEVRSHAREFAFMGQGEPGLCYPQVRRAILLTDCAMSRIGQSVHRYIISSSGIPEMLDLLIEDLRRKTFISRVTAHFSLHAVDGQRPDIMPIDGVYPYARFLAKAEEITHLTGEKLAVGILLFENFVSEMKPKIRFTTTKTYLDKIMDQLDPKYHRIDLCDLNMTCVILEQNEVSNEKARGLLAHVEQRGFDAKLFSSYGEDKNSGCGMLMSTRKKIQLPGITTITHFSRSVDLLRQVVKEGI